MFHSAIQRISHNCFQQLLGSRCIFHHPCYRILFLSYCSWHILKTKYHMFHRFRILLNLGELTFAMWITIIPIHTFATFIAVHIIFTITFSSLVVTRLSSIFTALALQTSLFSNEISSVSKEVFKTYFDNLEVYQSIHWRICHTCHLQHDPDNDICQCLHIGMCLLLGKLLQVCCHNHNLSILKKYRR